MIDRRDRSGAVGRVRPEFNWHSPDVYGNWDTLSCIGQLIEDSRNVLERIERSQTLQCDVAQAIKQSAIEIRKCRIALEKMAQPKRRRRKKV